MKKVSLALALLFIAVISMNASAQVSDLKFVGGKIGLITYLEGGIPFGASFEMPMKSVNPNLAVGAQFMYQGYSSDEYSSYDFINSRTSSYHWEYTYILMTAFGAYYYDVLKNDKIKTYAKLHLGYNSASVELVTNDDWLKSWLPKATAGGFIYGVNVGAKYMISPNLAGTLELGYGVSVLQLGLEYGF